MIRRNPDDAYQTIRRRVRHNAFRFSRIAFALLVDRFLYEEDVKRAVATSSLADTYPDPLGRTLFVLHGLGMNEEAVAVVCRLERTRVEVVDVFRLEDPG